MLDRSLVDHSQLSLLRKRTKCPVYATTIPTLTSQPCTFSATLSHKLHCIIYTDY